MVLLHLTLEVPVRQVHKSTVTDVQFVYQNEHCTTCDQTGDRRVMGPCHKGPIRREHDTPVQVHCHPKSTEEIHGDIVPARGSRLLDRAGKILAPVNPLAAAGAALAGVGIELFEADKCSSCGKGINTPGCMLRWECCKNEQDAEGCKEVSTSPVEADGRSSSAQTAERRSGHPGMPRQVHELQQEPHRS